MFKNFTIQKTRNIPQKIKFHWFYKIYSKVIEKKLRVEKIELKKRDIPRVGIEPKAFSL